jgi:hypothetical protein
MRSHTREEENMDRNDRQAIENLFEKLAEVARNSPRRYAESEAFIREQVARQPGAPYYMAQTIVVQEQALAAAEQRIQELESRRNGGLGRSGSVPSVNREPMAAQAGSGGFLAGAAQTALGVAGGWLLGNAIAGMFGADKAQAAQPETAPEAGSEAETTEADYDDGGFDDGGDSFGDFGDFDL